MRRQNTQSTSACTRAIVRPSAGHVDTVQLGVAGTTSDPVRHGTPPRNANSSTTSAAVVAHGRYELDDVHRLREIAVEPSREEALAAHLGRHPLSLSGGRWHRDRQADGAPGAHAPLTEVEPVTPARFFRRLVIRDRLGHVADSEAGDATAADHVHPSRCGGHSQPVSRRRQIRERSPGSARDVECVCACDRARRSLASDRDDHIADSGSARPAPRLGQRRFLSPRAVTRTP